MIRCFKKSIFASAGIFLSTIVVCVFIWIRNLGNSFYIPLIATGLMFLIGICSGIILGNVISSSENSRLLSILHVDLDPERFVRKYECVPNKASKAQRAIAISYLADGYSAMGQQDKALQTLSSDFSDRKGNEVLSLRCLYHNNRCHYMLLKRDVEAARKEIINFWKVLETTKKENEALYKNMKEAYLFYRNWLNYYEGKAVDTIMLSRKIQTVPFLIRRMEMQYLLAMTYERDGRKKDAYNAFNAIVEKGGKLFIAKDAASHLAKCYKK